MIMFLKKYDYGDYSFEIIWIHRGVRVALVGDTLGDVKGKDGASDVRSFHDKVCFRSQD